MNLTRHPDVRPSTLSLFLLLLLLGLSTACSSDKGSDPTSTSDTSQQATTSGEQSTLSGKVVVLCSRDEKFMTGLWSLVRERHPGLEVVVSYGKDAGFLDRLRVERDAPRVDLFLSKSSAGVESAANDGLLQPLPTSLLERVPERFRSAKGRWIGLSARARIVVARRMLASKPISVLDLADSKWRGRVARTVATNSSFVGGITSLIADQGETATAGFLAGLHANTEGTGNIYPKHTPTVAAVSEGRADLALVNHYYFYRSVLGKEAQADADPTEAERTVAEAPIVAIYPDADGTGVAWNVSGGGLVSGAANLDGAQAVLDVLLSSEGQQAYAWTNREYPVVDGVATPPGVTPADQFKWSATPLSKLAEQQPKAVEMIQALGMN